MKFDKGIYRDCNPVDQPAGTYRHAKNVIYNRKTGAHSTEGGTSFVTSIATDSIPLGSAHLGSDKEVLFYVGADGMSYIAIFTEPNVIRVVRSAVSIGFSSSYPIKAIAIKNQKGEDIVTWVDGLNSPRMINLDNPGFTNAELELYPHLLNLFPSAKVPILDSVYVSEDSGNVKTGTYYFAAAYELDGGGVSNYLAVYNPIAISKYSYTKGVDNVLGSASDLNSYKSIRLSLTNLDNQYSKLHLAVIKVINGVTSAYKVGEYDIPSSMAAMTITYTGTEIEESVLLESILINTNSYSVAKTIAYHNRKLYLGNLSKASFPDWQYYANNVIVKWNYDKNVSLDGIRGSFKDNAVSFKMKGFMPDEVYAFYGAFRLNDGSLSPAFHIPGRSALSGDTDVLSASGDYSQDMLLGSEVKKFQTRSTALSNGTMGYWENESEIYPGDFPDFAGENVRHHKFPGIPDLLAWGREYVTDTPSGDNNLFTLAGSRTIGVAEFPLGASAFDSETSSAANDISLSTFNTTTKRLEITGSGYADIFLSLAGSVGFTTSESDSYGVKISVDIALVQIKASGAEITLSVASGEAYESWSGTPMYFEANANISDTKRQVRVENGDAFYLRYGTEGTLLGFSGSVEFQFQAADSLSEYGGTKFANMLGIDMSNIVIPDEIKNMVQGFEVFYAKRGYDNSTVISQGIILNATANSPAALKYATGWSFSDGLRFYSPDLLANEAPPSIDADYLKIQSEITIGAGTAQVFKNGFTFARPASGTLSEQIIPISAFKYDPQTPDDYRETSLSCTVSKVFAGAVGTEMIMANLCSYRKDVYLRFYEQELVSTGAIFLIDQGEISVSPVLGGDVYNADFGFFTNFNDGVVTPVPDPKLWSCPLYSVVNAALRLSGEEYGQGIYPADYSAANGNLTFIGEGDRTKVDNYIWINPDISKLNDLNAAYVDIDMDDNVEEFPFRIIESDIQTKEGDSVAIRKFSPLNYYELTKNKGVITNLESAGQVLLIHTTESLFKTMSQVALKGDATNVILGNGEIFAITPEEIMAVPGGYAGTQDQQSCLYSKAGYFFVDRKYGKVFLLNQELKEISNNGLREFFKDVIKDDIRSACIAQGQAPPDMEQTRMIAAYDEDNYRIVFSMRNVTVDILKIGENGRFFKNKYYTVKGKLKKYTGETFYLEDGEILDELIDAPGGYLLAAKFDDLTDTVDYTFSYSIINQCWIAEHDYSPTHMFSTKKNMYGILGDSIYKHNVDFSPSIYAGSRMPWFIDFVFAIGKDALLFNINWQSEYISSSGDPDFFKTFDRVIVYNSFQCSGEKTITSTSPGANTRITRKVWNFNDFRDMVINNNLPSMVDFVPVSSNIDMSLDWYKQKRFIDKYHIIRLGDSNSRLNVLYLYGIDISARPTFR